MFDPDADGIGAIKGGAQAVSDAAAEGVPFARRFHTYHLGKENDS